MHSVSCVTDSNCRTQAAVVPAKDWEAAGNAALDLARVDNTFWRCFCAWFCAQLRHSAIVG